MTTAQYTYTFSGWARTAGGGMDSTALEKVTQDRTVYANFIAAVRYYTVTYYDADGVTVLKTESLAYGITPDFVPVKTGYTFNGWTTEIQAVTEDVSYVAMPWTVKMDFSALTWAQISNYCKTADVSELFDVGQRKTFTFKQSNTQYTATAEIVGFYHDDLADGTGKAPITLRLIECYKALHSWHGMGTTTRERTTWESTDIRSQLQAFATHSTYGPEQELKKIMKKVKKTYRVFGGGYATSEDQWFLPSLSELGYQIEGAEEGTCYEAYSDGKNLSESYPELKYVFPDGSVYKYWTRTKITSGQAYGIDLNGKAESVTHGTSSTDRYPFIFMCIG